MGGGGRFCILPNSRTRGLSEAAIEGSERVFFKKIKNLKKVASQVKVRLKVKIIIFCLIRTTEVALITAVNPNFVKKRIALKR